MDPTTIASAISAAIDYMNAGAEQSWQGTVSTDLADIISKLDEIDDFLHALPGIFVTALDNEQRKVWATDISAHVDLIDGLIGASPAGPMDSATRDAWNQELAALALLLYANMDYPNWGFEQFAIVSSGIAAAAGLAKYIDKKEVFSPLISKAVNYYSAAIDASTSYSFALSKINATASRNQIATVSDSMLNKYWCDGWGDSIPMPHGGSMNIDYTFMVPGSIESGLGNIQYSKCPDRVSPGYMPGTSGTASVQQALDYFHGQIANYSAIGNQIVNIQNCIDSCNSILGELRRLNTLRRPLDSLHSRLRTPFDERAA